MAVIEHTIGTVVANSTVSVTARVQGQLTKAYFKEGQMVKNGDCCSRSIPRPYQAAYDNALAIAGRRQGQGRPLCQPAGAECHRAARINDDAQAAYLQAKANAEAARLNLEYTKIRSPVDGKTGPILIQPGNHGCRSTALDRAAGDHHQIQPIKVSFALPQTDLPRIQARAQPSGLTATDRHCMTRAASD